MITADAITQQYKKKAIAPVRSGDTVRVHQRIREGSKQRVQVFEGVVIRTDRMNELSARVTVRRIASGVGVEKSFLLHSPKVNQIEVMRRAKVRRNYLSYLRARRGKSARLTEAEFDRKTINAIADNETPASKQAAEAADAPTEDELDAEVTELNVEEVEDEQVEVVATTDEVAESENKNAADADIKSDKDHADDESQLDAEEIKQGVDAAEAKE